MTKAKKESTKEMSERERREVTASVRDTILKNTEAHPFYDQSPDNSVVVVAKEIEFLDTDSSSYRIPRGVTITIIRGSGGVWSVERHTD